MAVTKLKPVDAVVVGMGVVGTIVAKELAQTGIKVVGLERGRMLDPVHDFAMPYMQDELKYHRHSDILQNLSRETVTFRNAMNETALPMREYGSFKPGECVGGAGVHWGGGAFRFLPWEFEARSRTIERYGKDHMHQDCTSQDWGITYEDLEPYYDQFEHLYGIGGKAGNLNGEIQPGGNPYEGPRSREYPNPPSPVSYAGAMFADAAASLGYKPFRKPTAAMTRPYTNPYKLTLGQCVRGGACNSHLCAMGAKGSPATAVLPALLKHENFELRPLANVIKVNVDSTGKRAVSVTYLDAKRHEVEQPADLIVLASYALNNTRLMLLSGIGKPYDPVRNEGVVGRNYAYQTVGGKVTMFYEDRVFNRFMGGGGMGTIIDEFNGDNFDHTGLGFIGGGFIDVISNGAQPIRSRPLPPGTPHWGPAWKKAVSHYYDRSLAIGMNGCSQAWRTNYLDLDPTYKDANGLPLLRLTFDWTENDKRMMSYLVDRAAEIGKVMKPAILHKSPPLQQYGISHYQSTHNTGGVVMGTDPKTSVVNKYLQSWDLPNLFVVGGSAFPQNAGCTPTGTIGAIACWAADSIKDEYLKNPRPLG